MNYEMNALYVTKNSAPRNVFCEKLIGGDYSKSFVRNLFKSSGTFTQTEKNQFDVLIVDEAHHALSDSYQKVLRYFQNAKVLGVTATPDRGDKKNLAEYFESTAYEYTMAQAIKDGYLCPIRAQMIPLKIDMSEVKTTAGDYNVGDIILIRDIVDFKPRITTVIESQSADGYTIDVEFNEDAPEEEEE